MDFLPLMPFPVLATAVVLLRHATPRSRLLRAHDFARKVDLRLEDPDGDGVVTRRLARRRGAGAVGGLVLGVAAAVAAPAPDADAGFASSGLLLVVLGWLAGYAVGSAVIAWYESSRPVRPGPRLARVTVPEHGDYVARVERWGAWVTAGVSAAVAGGLAAVEGLGLVELGPLPGALVAAAVVVPVLLVVVDELAARWLLGRRQAAATPLDLAWDDALRSLTLRDGVTVALVAGVYLPLLLLGAIGDGLEGGWPANPAVGLVNGLFAALLLALLGVGVASIALRPERHFRRRLWPTPPVAPDVPAAGATGGAR
ncbi:hypothetical protein [Actinotalea solisilvae]|uniref:hypothetical protein n=1 Tax=Actinotalea solisilvae TaxID=2072922 RepID=UPI0018F17D23|nr:hypothetical protein [Actinotalea solisilvae]